MIEVTFFRNMRKEVNSTAIPSGGNFDNSVLYSCALFDPCSVQNPKIWLNAGMADIHDFNYAYIPHFDRYYWVSDLQFVDGRWLASLSCDVLASFKNDIGASTQYVLRSASDYNENIIDTIYTPTGGKFELQQTITNPFATALDGGTFVIGYTSASPVMGSNAYAIMTSAQMTIFLSQLMGNTNYLNLDNTDLSSDVAKAILNPIQYIQSIKWFPFSITGATPSSYMFFGWWIISAAHSDILLSDSFRRNITFSFPIPKHPLSGTRGKYLNLSPYSQYRLFLPIVGYVELPASLLYDYNGLTVEYHVDLITGIAHVSIYSYTSDASLTSNYIYQTDCNLAIDIPFAQISVDKMGAASGAVGSVAGAIGDFISGNIAGGIQTLVNGGIDAYSKSITPIPAFSGGVGNLGAYAEKPVLSNIYQMITDEAYDMYGRPLCEKRQLNTLSGFTMCATPHLAIPGATSAESEQVVNYLQTGFFWE